MADQFNILDRGGWRRLMSGRARLDATTAQTLGLNENAANGPTGSSGGLNAFYFDPADYPAGSKLRIRGTVLTNDVAPTCNFTFGLYPTTTPGGAAASVTAPFGTVLAGSTAAINTPALDTASTAVSTAFDMPTAGFYAIGIVTNSNMAASSAASVRGTLEIQ